MSLQAALAFLGQARRDKTLRAGIESLGNDATYEALAEIGAAAGFGFTPEELARAHSVDWGLRRARYSR